MSKRKSLQRAEVEAALARIRRGEHEYRIGKTRAVRSLSDLFRR